jgi:hypothetical protein
MEMIIIVNSFKSSYCIIGTHVYDEAVVKHI